MNYEAFNKAASIVMEFYTSNQYSAARIQRVELALTTIREQAILHDQFSLTTIEESIVGDESLSSERKKTVIHIVPMLELADVTGRTESKRICKTRKEIILPQKLSELLSEYSVRLNKLYTKKNTIKSKVTPVKNFLCNLYLSGITDIEQLKVHNLDSYLGRGMDRYACRTKREAVYDIRQFLHYLYQKEYICFELGFYFDDVTISVPDKVITILSEEQSESLIDSRNKGGDASLHCRNKVICLCALLLGLRISDILNLKFGNIDWDNSTISIVQMKTNEFLSIPFPDILGYELANYISKFRTGATGDDYVFLATKAPYNHLSKLNKSTIEMLIPDTTGALADGAFHMLRRTFASKLLSERTDIATIANLLGHSSLDALDNYLDIDEEMMFTTPIQHPCFELPEVLK